MHTIIDALPLSKSSTTLRASRPSGRSVTSVCAPHNALRRGPATISAAGVSFTNTSVRGGGLSSPAAIASARICRHKVTNFLPGSEYNTRWRMFGGSRLFPPTLLFLLPTLSLLLFVAASPSEVDPPSSSPLPPNFASPSNTSSTSFSMSFFLSSNPCPS